MNYLWSATLFISTIYVFYKYKDSNENISLLKKWLIFFLAFLCGASNEAFSIGLSTSFLIYYLFHPKEFNGIIIYITFGLWIGTAILVFSPANLYRFTKTTENDLIYALKTRLDNLSMKYTQLASFFIFISLIIIAKLKKTQISSIINKYNLLSNTALITFIFLLFIGFHGSFHMFSSIIIIATFFIIKYIFLNNFIYKNRKIVSIISLFLLIVHYIFVLQYRQQEQKIINNSVTEYINSNTGLTTYYPIKQSKLIYIYGTGMNNMFSLSSTLNGINQFYFNCQHPKPLLIPNLTKGITQYNKIEGNDVYSIYNDEYFFIVKLTSPENEYEFYTEDYSFDSIMLRIWFKYLAQRPNRIKVYSDRIEYNNETYYIIRKKQQDKTIHNIKINEI